MCKVMIHQIRSEDSVVVFRATAGQKQATGRTAGQALDALIAQLPAVDVDTVVIVQSIQPDRYFTAKERERLEELVALKREALAKNSSLSPEQTTELENLVEAELQAATVRAEALSERLAQ